MSAVGATIWKSIGDKDIRAECFVEGTSQNAPSQIDFSLVALQVEETKTFSVNC